MLQFIFFNDTATTEIYTLPYTTLFRSGSRAGPALPIAVRRQAQGVRFLSAAAAVVSADRKSTRLNSSHSQISYAVFCLKKKNILDSHSVRLTYYAANPAICISFIAQSY